MTGSISTFDPTTALVKSKLPNCKPTLKERGSLRQKDVSAVDNVGLCGGHRRDKFPFVGSGFVGLPIFFTNPIAKSLNQLLERPRDPNSNIPSPQSQSASFLAVEREGESPPSYSIMGADDDPTSRGDLLGIKMPRAPPLHEPVKSSQVSRSRIR